MIGVISSLIASIIIFFVSKFVFRRKINKEKAQRISMARKDVIYAIRPMILEKRLIPSSQLSLFLSSLAKQYEVDAIDIYDYQGLSEDLIKEILLNHLLSIDNRVKYCNFIETFLKSGLEKNSIICKQSFRAVLCTSIYISTFVPNLNFGQDEHKRRRQVLCLNGS